MLWNIHCEGFTLADTPATQTISFGQCPGMTSVHPHQSKLCHNGCGGNGNPDPNTFYNTKPDIFTVHQSHNLIYPARCFSDMTLFTSVSGSFLGLVCCPCRWTLFMDYKPAMYMDPGLSFDGSSEARGGGLGSCGWRRQCQVGREVHHL